MRTTVAASVAMVGEHPPIHQLHDCRNTLTARLESIGRPDMEIFINDVDGDS